MVLLVNAPSMITHVIMPVVSVATAAGMVAAGITLGLTIARLLSNDNVVLASSATIVLNRFIPPGVVPFYADAAEATILVVDGCKSVLQTLLGDAFVNAELVSFSPTPIEVTNVTNSDQENQSSTSNLTNQTTTISPLKKTTTTTVLIESDTNTTSSIATTNRTSIIQSKMIFYFLQSKSQAISTTNIMITLNNLQTSIALLSLNGTADARSSSFNKTLSNVEPPKATTLNAAALASQPSISPALAQAISAAASAALNDAGLGYLVGSTTSYSNG